MCVCAKSLQSCLTLCNPMDCSLPGSSVYGILQARILEWVAMASRGSSQPSNPCLLHLLHWQVCSLPLVPPGKPQPGLLHCRQILHGMSHQGRPLMTSVQFNSASSVVSWLFATPWTAACQPSLSITNSWSVLKLMFIESVMPSNHLILCHPLLLLPSIFPSVRVFYSESVLRIRWPKYWSFSFSISPSNEYSGLISFRMDWLDLFAVQGTLKSLLQQHSSNWIPELS